MAIIEKFRYEEQLIDISGQTKCHIEVSVDRSNRRVKILTYGRKDKPKLDHHSQNITLTGEAIDQLIEIFSDSQ